VPETRFDENGVTQRNLFFQTKTLAWSAIESARIDSYSRRSKDSAGWVRDVLHRVIELKGGEVKIRVDQVDRDTKGWWKPVTELIRQKVATEKIV
jgi:hypothetical protein